MSDPYKECGLEIFNEVVLGKGGQAEIREILKKHFPESPPVASYEDFRQAGVLMDQKARENAGEADRPYFRSDGKGASGIANDWNNLR